MTATSPAPSTRTVSCACGTVTFALAGAPFLVAECMCSSCRAADEILEALPGAPALLDAKDATLATYGERVIPAVNERAATKS